MDLSAELQDNIDLEVQEVLLAASNHDIPRLRALLRSDPSLASAQDLESGFAALHAAVAACEDDEPSGAVPHVNGEGSARVNGAVGGDVSSSLPAPECAPTAERAKATVLWLLQRGAVWSQVDAKGETPGCIAGRLGLWELYRVLVDAGTRVEMVRSRRGGYERLPDSDDEGDADVEMANETAAQDGEQQQQQQQLGHEGEETVVRFERGFRSASQQDGDGEVDQDWRLSVLRQTGDALLPAEGLRVLSITGLDGFSETLLHGKRPASHCLITAAERRISDEGNDSSNAEVRVGKWQDIVPRLVTEGRQFDAIFFAVLDEDYSTFQHFFADHIPDLMVDTGRWSFLNTLGSGRQIEYEVCKNILSMDIQECGQEIEWTEINSPCQNMQGYVDNRSPTWNSVKYYLPVCSFFS